MRCSLFLFRGAVSTSEGEGDGEREAFLFGAILPMNLQHLRVAACAREILDCAVKPVAIVD
jgi:hypothetical protein